MPLPFLDEFRQDALRENRIRFLQEGAPRFFERWHWFQYHFSRLPPTRFGQSIIDACIRLETVRTGLGLEFLAEIARLGGRDRDWRDYDQILQKLAELLVINAVAGMNWPATPSIQVEERAPGSPKGVDCVATRPERKYGFEIKAPALLAHRKNRAENDLQIPGRFVPHDHLERISEIALSGVTLPRDNPVYDFLVSANKKFAPFKQMGDFTGILVIVWDDFIYEPITSLRHERCGLLTPDSYKRTGDQPECYPFVDAVILLRHLTYFTAAAAEEPLSDHRRDAFHIGGEGALPNVIIPVTGGNQIPDYILKGLRAFPLSDPLFEHAAEYQPLDFVWWHNAVSQA
jgi:hypothetical protein